MFYNRNIDQGADGERIEKKSGRWQEVAQAGPNYFLIPEQFEQQKNGLIGLRLSPLVPPGF